MQASSPLQEYLFALPALTQHPVIAGLGAASIILLAIALICSLTLTISKITLNSFVLPNKDLQQQPALSEWINRPPDDYRRDAIDCLLIAKPGGQGSQHYRFLSGRSLWVGPANPRNAGPLSIFPEANRLGFIVGLKRRHAGMAGNPSPAPAVWRLEPNAALG